MTFAATENGKKVLTMTEYIEREAISEEIRKYYYKNPPNFSYGEGFDRGLDRAQRAIADAPAADVAPVRHGRWLSWDELHGGNTRAKNVLGVFCSECIRQSDSKTRFCHNCGARMDKEALECDT